MKYLNISILDQVECSYRGGKMYTTSEAINNEFWGAEIVGKLSYFIYTSFDETDYLFCMKSLLFRNAKRPSSSK